MKQVLSDEAVKAVHQALPATYTYPEFARAVEQAVLSELEPLLRRVVFLLDVNDKSPPDDIDAALLDIDRCIADVRKLLGAPSGYVAPCPHCGHRGTRDPRHSFSIVENKRKMAVCCGSCGALGPAVWITLVLNENTPGSAEARALAEWNRRQTKE